MQQNLRSRGEMLFAYQEPRIEGIRHYGNSLDTSGIGMSRIDEHVVRLRHQHRANNQQRGIPFPQPAIAPGSRDSDSSGPVGRQLRLIDRLPGHLIGDVKLDEAVMSERRRFAHLTVNENLEHRGRRIRRAVKNLLAACVPARRGE